MLSLEIGSYMKVWVRNGLYHWQDDGPADRYREALQNSMEVDNTGYPGSMAEHK